ncbi:uncharacterized protein PAC_10854 [Phialocephala subalpina]|uniref:Uncharacterized protein n=1 Tax=Phialocephala subalpina TaxID=576137 RepID=A0A1L7X7G0_9HELO|nr:uncharacterized protein PAC_10854 [Phialocephala subalpina]
MTLRGQYECVELTVKFTFGTAACSLAPCFQAHVHPRVAARSMRISILQTPSRTNRCAERARAGPSLRARRPKDPDYDISQTQTHGENDDPLDDLKLHMLPFSASFKPDSSSMLYVLGLL